MDTIQIRFTGKAGTVSDPILGLSWSVGEIKDVPRDKAQFYLYYADSFADARAKKKRDADPITPREFTLGAIKQLREGYHANLSVMPLESLQRYAFVNFRRELPSDMPLPQMRKEISDLMRRAS